MSENYVAVLKQDRSVKGQSFKEGTELGAVAITAVKGLEPKNIETLMEQGLVELLSPEDFKKKQAPSEKKVKTEAK